MSHNQERAPGKRRGSDINEVQDLASHDIGPTSPKPSSPSEEPDSRILRGYCGGYKSGKPMPMSVLGPGPDPRKAHPLAMGRTLFDHKCSRRQREQLGPGDDILCHFAEQEKY